MAVCPNCGRKLHMTDWRPNCPGCGVNLNYFNANEILLDETEKAEVEHAHFQPKVDRAKAAYIGDKRCILRIIFTLLPTGALFLPLATYDKTVMNIIGVYKMLSETGFDNLLSNIKLLIPLGTAAVSVVMILVCLILLTMSLGKRGKRRTFILYGIMAAGAILSLLSMLIFKTAIPAFGAYIYAVLQVWSFAWNYQLIKRGIEVHYTQCLIGGLPSETYFEYVEKGMTSSEIRRKMLIALTEQQIEYERENNRKFLEETAI